MLVAAEVNQTRRELVMGLKPRSSPVPRTSGTKEARIRSGLALLRDAWERARELGQDARDVAVDIRKLNGLGLTNTDLRWLVCKGYAEHGIMEASADAGRQSFRKLPSLTLPEGTCFVLTAQGLQASREESGAGGTPVTPAGDGSDAADSAGERRS
jgi:hypothetical protein